MSLSRTSATRCSVAQLLFPRHRSLAIACSRCDCAGCRDRAFSRCSPSIITPSCYRRSRSRHCANRRNTRPSGRAAAPRRPNDRRLRVALLTQHICEDSVGRSVLNLSILRRSPARCGGLAGAASREVRLLGIICNVHGVDSSQSISAARPRLRNAAQPVAKTSRGRFERRALRESVVRPWQPDNLHAGTR